MLENYLKENCSLIHYFGLGFVQLKMKNPQERYHFYNSKHLQPFCENPHNHRYDFQSEILAGRLTQTFYAVECGITHIKEYESCNKDKKCDLESTGCSIVQTSQHLYNPGSKYFIGHRQFHTVQADYCITKLTRADHEVEFAEVIRAKTEEKKCPFSLKISEVELWKIVEEMCQENWL